MFVPTHSDPQAQLVLWITQANILGRWVMTFSLTFTGSRCTVPWLKCCLFPKMKVLNLMSLNKQWLPGWSLHSCSRGFFFFFKSSSIALAAAVVCGCIFLRVKKEHCVCEGLGVTFVWSDHHKSQPFISVSDEMLTWCMSDHCSALISGLTKKSFNEM